MKIIQIKFDKQILKQILKQIFCRHEWTEIEYHPGGHRYQCYKCKKTKK